LAAIAAVERKVFIATKPNQASFATKRTLDAKRGCRSRAGCDHRTNATNATTTNGWSDAWPIRHLGESIRLLEEERY
jgi:hypothetical protein